MSEVFADISVSLDGFVAGPSAGPEAPLGLGGERLHQWVIGLRSWRESHGLEGGEAGPDADVVAESVARTGAVVMGRRMFSGGSGPWEDDPIAEGWWGEDPPFRVPVFVLTHHERAPLTLGETTFTFVTEGPESALAGAREAAGDRDVSIAGGAITIQQYLAAGAIGEIQIHLVPVLLGDGARLLEGLGEAGLELERVRVIDSPKVTHLSYRVSKR